MGDAEALSAALAALLLFYIAFMVAATQDCGIALHCTLHYVHFLQALRLNVQNMSLCEHCLQQCFGSRLSGDSGSGSRPRFLMTKIH